LLERVFGDGASGWSDGLKPPHTNARAAAFDTGREGRPELDLRARAGIAGGRSSVIHWSCHRNPAARCRNGLSRGPRSVSDAAARTQDRSGAKAESLLR